jgi:hypothetical protein
MIASLLTVWLPLRLLLGWPLWLFLAVSLLLDPGAGAVPPRWCWDRVNDDRVTHYRVHSDELPPDSSWATYDVPQSDYGSMTCSDEQDTPDPPPGQVYGVLVTSCNATVCGGID